MNIEYIHTKVIMGNSNYWDGVLQLCKLIKRMITKSTTIHRTAEGRTLYDIVVVCCYFT